MEIERLPLGQSPSDRQRAAHYKWVNMPSGLSPELASKFMLGLHGGKTIKDLTNGGDAQVCSFARFRKHCELNQAWGIDARRLSDVNSNAKKKASHHKSQKTREFCMKGLHAMAGSNVRIDPSTGRRACLACRYIARDNPPLIKPDVLTKIRRALEAGATYNQICNGEPAGGGKINRKLILTTSHKFYQQRRLDPEFDRFVRLHFADSAITGQTIRWRRIRTHVRTEAARNEANDFRAILALIPSYILGRDDVAQDIFIAVLEGSLRREDVRSRVKWHVAEHNKKFPPKFAKFGDSKLLSLDEVMFDDGSTTRGDNVSRGLWD